MILRVLIDDVKAVVAAEHGLTVKELVGPRRARRIAHARQIAMTLAWRLTRNTLPKIGDLFGGRDHSTVNHAIKVVSARAVNLSALTERVLAEAEERRRLCPPIEPPPPPAELPWGTMETAPLDGTPLRVQVNGRAGPYAVERSQCFADGRWRYADTMQPVLRCHRPVRWKPLPVEQKQVAA